MTWKRISIWAGAAIITLGMVAAIITAVLVKQSPSFRQGLLARAESNIYATTGTRVAVRDFSLDFFPLNLDLYGVVVRGTEPQFGEPLLRADRVGAGIEMRSLLGRKWSLREVVIDHPVVHLFVDQAGGSNLPQPETGSRIKANVFDVALRELRLHGAEVDCNEKKLLLDGDWHNLHATADFDGSVKRYSGVLNYTEGKVKYGEYPPFVHSLDLSLYAAATKLTVDHLALAAGKSRIAVTGSVEDYSHPTVQATYDAHVTTSDAAPFLKNVSLPAAGVVDVAGSVSYRRDPNRPALEVIALNGTVSSPALTVMTPGLRADLIDLGGRYKLAAGNAEMQAVHAQVFAGKMTGSLSVHDLTGASTAKLQARLKDASLEELQRAARHDASPQAQLRGRISADIEASWSRAWQDLAAHGNLTLAGTLGRNPAAPLRGAIHAEYTAVSHQLSLRQSYIRTAQTSVTLDGSVSEQSQLQVSLRSANLHEVELLAENFSPAPPGQSLQSFDLYGTGSFTGSVSGPAGTPHLKGQVEASDLRVRGTRWKLLRADIDASPSSLSFSNGSLEAAGWTPEKLHPPEPGAATTGRSEGQISQSRDLATVK